jgi:transketolase N-terminal domain/subunit
MEKRGIDFRRDLTSLVVFLRSPLSIKAISSLSGTEKTARQLLSRISRLNSVIHVPDQQESPITLFHASFFDFVTDPTRCTPQRCRSFNALIVSEGHELLAFKCLVHMNGSLKRNICDVPTATRRESTNSHRDISKVSEAQMLLPALGCSFHRCAASATQH